MPTDKQLREQFDAFVYRQTVNRDYSAPWPTPTELAWLAWQARDAEVQALQRALKDARFLIGKLAGWQGVDLSELDDEYDGVITRINAALAGGEKGETE